MLNMMSQPQWTLPWYGPQTVRSIRSQPYERSDQNQRPTVLASALNPMIETTPPEVGHSAQLVDRYDLRLSGLLDPAGIVSTCFY